MKCEHCDTTDIKQYHIFTLQITNIQYKVTDANYLAPEIYDKICECGVTGIETFESGEKNTNNHVKVTFIYMENARMPLKM